MNKAGKVFFKAGVESQKLAEIPLFGPVYEAARHRLHDSEVDNFIKNVHWTPIWMMRFENGKPAWLPEARGHPDTPPWTDYVQSRKKTSVVVRASIEEMKHLAAKFPEGVPSLTIRFEDIALAGLFPRGFDDLRVSDDGGYYEAAGREGAVAFEAGLTITSSVIGISHTPQDRHIFEQNVPNDLLDSQHPGISLI